jgi:hypothetical protein
MTSLEFFDLNKEKKKSRLILLNPWLLLVLCDASGVLFSPCFWSMENWFKHKDQSLIGLGE